MKGERKRRGGEAGRARRTCSVEAPRVPSRKGLDCNLPGKGGA